MKGKFWSLTIFLSKLAGLDESHLTIIIQIFLVTHKKNHNIGTGKGTSIL